MANKMHQGVTTIGSTQDPPHKIEFSQLMIFLRKLAGCHYKGSVIVEFWGKDGVYGMLRPEGKVQYFPITELKDIEEMVKKEETDD